MNDMTTHQNEAPVQSSGDAENPLLKMSQTAVNSGRFKVPIESDWRIVFGSALTAIYLFLMALYVSSTVGLTDFIHLPVELMGNFLEGAFAPLAFLWLVIGYFLQKKELMQNTEAMKMQFIEIQKSAQQAERQAEAISASEVHQRRESFLRIAEAVNRQLGSIIGMLFMSSQSAGNNDQQIPSEKMSEMWASLGTENHEIFSRALLRVLLQANENYRFKVLYGTEIRKRHTDNFMFNFERMIAAARACDEEGVIADALMGSAHGFVHNRINFIRDNIPPGFTIGEYDFDPDDREESEEPDSTTA